MIVGQLTHWTYNFTGAVWARVFDHLSQLTPDAVEGITQIQDDAIYARVMSYDTRDYDAAVIETHERYIDVQMSLVGAEGIDWFPRSGLEVKQPYDASTDRTLYRRPGDAPAHVDNHPGTYTVLFPEDAHMPQLIVGEIAQTIKKVVVKVQLDLVR